MFPSRCDKIHQLLLKRPKRETEKLLRASHWFAAFTAINWGNRFESFKIHHVNASMINIKLLIILSRTLFQHISPWVCFCSMQTDSIRHCLTQCWWEKDTTPTSYRADKSQLLRIHNRPHSAPVSCINEQAFAFVRISVNARGHWNVHATFLHLHRATMTCWWWYFHWVDEHVRAPGERCTHFLSLVERVCAKPQFIANLCANRL